MLHVFPGPEDRIGLRESLANIMPGLQLVEFDISCCRGSEAGETLEDTWNKIRERLCKGGWLLYCTLPARTFSRARHTRPGPPPLRSSEHPYGFPWLQQSFAQQVKLDNDFILQAVESAIACSEHDSFFILDHPEQLGVASDDVVPATPWGFQEIQDLVPRCSAVTFALYQCHFGSSTSKPTRFLGNLPQWRTSVPHCAGFASLDSQGRYKGPLPPRCGHKHASLLRAQSDGWHAGASPRFPAELCDFIASAIAAVGPSGMGGSQTPACNKSLVVGPPAVFPPGSPLSSTGSSLESMPQEHPSTYTTGDAANLDDPDAFAENILRSGAEVSREHILEMYKLLPKERPSRASEDAEDPGTSFSVGVYFHAGSVRLRHHTRLLPNCAKLLCAYWRRELPQHSFSTISLFENVRTSLHKDGRNGTCYNAIVAVSDFVRGGLWLEDKDGDVVREVNGESVRGRVHPVVSVPFIFEARDRYHCTEPWEGQRLVMVAFTVPECEKLDKDDAAFVVDLGFPIKGKAADVDHAIPFRPELCGNYGIPVKVSWAGSEGPLTDGFGLCSPSRWTPSARGARLGETARRFASAMHTLVKSFVLRVTPDPERTAMELVLGRYTSSPFSEKDMAQLRKQWVSLLGDSQGFDLLEVPERQPFFLPALARTAELLEDPDWEIVTQGNDNFCTGVPLGCEEILPQVPQVFDFKYKSRTLDESEYDWDRSNYQSARDFEAPLHEKFREEERLGRMLSTTLGALKERFGSERIRIASLGAIGKPDGGARPIHDATHGVQVNNAIRIESQQAVPGPADLSYVVEEPIRRGEVPFCVSADVTAAHRLSKVREQDWPYLACRADDSSPTIWVNTVGTFGVS